MLHNGNQLQCVRVFSRLLFPVCIIHILCSTRWQWCATLIFEQSLRGVHLKSSAYRFRLHKTNKQTPCRFDAAIIYPMSVCWRDATNHHSTPGANNTSSSSVGGRMRISKITSMELHTYKSNIENTSDGRILHRRSKIRRLTWKTNCVCVWWSREHGGVYFRIHHQHNCVHTD